MLEAAQLVINEKPVEIPDKLYFRMGEASRLIGVPPYVLRFWEKEFPMVTPKKSGTGHRLYRRKDVELLLEVKQLLYEKRYTIEGARKSLELRPKNRKRQHHMQVSQSELFSVTPPTLDDIRKELAALLELLK
jgi:DNA-binding transcriptional MerR regulator